MDRLAHVIHFNGARHEIHEVEHRKYSLFHVPDAAVPDFKIGTRYDGRPRAALFEVIRLMQSRGQCICTARGHK